MTLRPSALRSALRSAVLAAVATSPLLTGCSSLGLDGVELQGGIFDALGVSGSGEKKSTNTKIAARPGLVLPPAEDRLPAPEDSAQIAAAQTTDGFPVDQDERKLQSKAERAKKHAAFCEKALQDARIRGQSGVVIGPDGNCQPGAFGSLTDLISGKSQ